MGKVEKSNKVMKKILLKHYVVFLLIVNLLVYYSPDQPLGGIITPVEVQEIGFNLSHCWLSVKGTGRLVVAIAGRLVVAIAGRLVVAIAGRPVVIGRIVVGAAVAMGFCVPPNHHWRSSIFSSLAPWKSSSSEKSFVIIINLCGQSVGVA